MRKLNAIVALIAVMLTAFAPAAMGSMLPMDQLCCKRTAQRSMEHCDGMAMGQRHTAAMQQAGSSIVSGRDCGCCAPIAKLPAPAIATSAVSFALVNRDPLLAKSDLTAPAVSTVRFEPTRGPPSLL
jgi:hypothetical protein